MCAAFRSHQKLPRIKHLLSVRSSAAPVDLRDGGNLDAELAYGNHPSGNAHRDAISDNIIAYVLGLALVFDVKYIPEIMGLCVSPLGVVEEPKFRTIHELTSAAGTTIPSSLNDDTDFAEVPECRLGHVLHEIQSRVFNLGQLHGVRLKT